MSDRLIEKLKATKLAIVEHLDEIKKSIICHNNLVLQAEPGAGKTTIVPLSLLDVFPTNKKILVLEPRRLAAKNAASRMAELLGDKVGQQIGYRIRNEVKVSAKTRIEVITEGILTRMLQSDPEIADVAMIIFDEFHERSLDADIGLAFSIEVQQSLREDLKLIVMSATLDTGATAKLLNNAPVITSKGRVYPVAVEYLPPKKNVFWLEHMSSAIALAMQTNTPEEHQDILVFLPGVAEIKRAYELLEKRFQANTKIKVMSLFGDLDFKQQQRVLLPIRNTRKIILSTNLAETSITINGVGWVIDSGLMRQSTFDPNVAFSRLKTIKISQASAVQRSGRAGRTAAGNCFRLWPATDRLRDENQAEILRADLSSFCLELAQWGCDSAKDLKLLDQPNLGMFEQAQELLGSLSAIDRNNKITLHGKLLSKMAVHPRIGHMLAKSVDLGAAKFACLLASMIEEKDILSGEQRFNPDFMFRVDCLLDHSFHSLVKKQIFKQAGALERKLKNLFTQQWDKQMQYADCRHLAGVLTAMVYPDRIAQKRGSGYRLSNGSGAVVDDDFPLADELLVVVKLGGQGSTARIFQAIGLTKIELQENFCDQIEVRKVVDWDNKNQLVKAQSNTQFGELVLKSEQIEKPDPQLILKGLIKGINQHGLACLPWSKELRQWQSRVQMLRTAECYKSTFLNVSDHALSKSIGSWLSPYLSNLSKLSQITSDILSQALKSQLDWQAQKQLDELMPLSIKVASGSRVKVDYLNGEKPVLAVKLQEMFATKQTPTIANGQLSVVVHLLSPARRPLQITEDLQSFWENGYPEVKKEMKGRYPKHPWPDDPLTALATRYTKKRLK